MKNWKTVFVVSPWIAFAISFGLYVFTQAPGYMPGDSAFFVLQAFPESMFPTFGYTLWHSIVEALDLFPGRLVVKLGVFSALCGALTVFGLMHISLRIMLGETPEEQRTPVPGDVLRAIMLGVTFLVALCIPPLWFGATRPFPQQFGLMCMSLIGALTLATFQKRSPGMLNLTTLLWGWVVTEYAAAWFFVPFFAVAVLMTGFDVLGKFRWMRNLRLLCLFLLAAGLGYLWMSWRVLHHPHAEIQTIFSFGDAFWKSLGVQRDQLRAAAPTNGSLLVLLMFGGPFLVVMMPKQHGTLDIRIGSVLLHMSCAVINGIILFHPGFSPWGQYQQGSMSVFMVVPYAMLALSTGYLASYWVAVLWKYDPYQPYFLKVPRFILRAIVVPVIVGLVGVSTVRNVLRWSDDGVQQVNALASTMATELTDVDLYFGNCGFNSVLQLVMRDQGVKTRLVTTEPLLWSRAAFRTIVASWFQDSPRLASMAEIGAYPFFSVVVEDESRNVIIGDFPDLVYRQGFVPLPVMFGYRGVKEVDANELKTSQEALMTFWAGVDTEGLWDVGTVDQSQRATLSVRNMIAAESRRANNLGVLLEKEGETESNLAAYRMSRSLFPQNVSALLNLAFHMDTLPEREQASVKQEMDNLLTDMGKNRLNLWRMSDVYGYISHPMAHVQRGMGWAVSGKPNLAVREYRQALRQDPNSVALRLNLASALLADQETEQAEQAYIEVLSEDPESVSALAGMLRVYAGRGDVQEARAYLERIRDLQRSSNFVYREELGLLALEGDMDGIRTLITKWRKEHADTLEPLLAGIALAMQDRDQEQVDLLLVKADQLSRYSPDERLKYARILFALSQPEKAKATLRPLLDVDRYAVPAREILLQYTVGARDQKSSIQYVLEILSREPRHAFAHYILGSIRYSQGRLSEAEASFRASLEQGDYAPALNDLAYLLLEKNRPEEALPFARKAVSGSSVSGGNWDTLASVLLELGKVDEAYAAQVNAMNAAPESPSFRLTLARIYQAQGKRDEVMNLVEELYRVEDRLTVRQKNFLRELTGNDG